MKKKKIPAIMVAGVSSGSGKTTVTRGILSYFVEKGLKVQSYKLGPDYIDSGHHAIVTGRPCINLDRYLLSVPDAELENPTHVSEQVLSEFYGAIGDADVLVIEAVGGLFDDWHNDLNSPAEIAKLLGVPVLVVMDARASCQTAGIMASGLIDHDPKLDLSGFVFTRVNSERHFESIMDGVDKAHQSLSFSYLPYKKELHTEERHLGLHIAEEMVKGHKITEFARIFGQYLDLEHILHSPVEFVMPEELLEKSYIQEPSPSSCRCRFAVAKDRAFSFYYETNLALLRSAGAELVYFSPLEDTSLPENIAGIYFGGGYPELHAEQLANNVSLRNAIRQAASDGMPIYAECGGLIYLGEQIEDHETRKMFPGVGIFPYESRFSPRLYLGYTRVEVTEDCLLGPVGTLAHGHVFHRSDTTVHGEITRSVSIYHKTKNMHQPEGYTYRNVYASYAHLHFKSAPQIPQHIIEVARRYITSQK